MLKILKLNFLGNFSHFGLLILRVGLGLSFMVHGYPKITGGTGRWEALGNMAGLPFPLVFGFGAAAAEFVGGLFILLGFYTRLSSLAMMGTMLGALNFHLSKGDPFNVYSHSMELAIVFAALALVGPGKLSLDKG